ncbi:uncharacterized protein LOC118463781 isoform X3 [Anopheles albimanus]|uniref:uncharacterized protein LOC118463781 isoform X3 n=1 Tax=Anopheles albimanus TaxID=7167 RepID=UPI0016415DD4|nr:uncharacterized protein LOC118463781 isoform X3 [Anopheles albimanus]
MAAARHDSKKRKLIESNHQIQRAKPSSLTIPMILPSSRKPTNVLPSNSSPSVVRKLAAVLPRMQQSNQFLAKQMCSVGFKATSSTPVPVSGVVRKVVMTDTDSKVGIRVDSLAEPKLSGTGGLNTIVSFAGSASVCIPTVMLPSTIGGAESDTAAVLGVSKLATADVRTIAFAKSPNSSDAIGNGTAAPRALETIAVTVDDTRKTEAQYNVAPGWRRVLRNQVIVYISPSEKMLYNLKQVREYLLSAGTCKCGLPCPFHPDVFFQFDCQVPNIMLETSKNGKTLCSHSFASSTVRSETIHKAAAGTTSAGGLNRKNSYPSAGVQNDITCTNRKIRSATLKKVPSWRKSVSPASQSNLAVVTNTVTAPVTQPTKFPLATKLSGALSTTFVFNTQAKIQTAQTKPLSISISENQIQTIDYSAKGELEGIASKKKSPEEKKVTFKDDPTGYLNQQTAMLHSSISILHSPDRRSPLVAVGGQNTVSHISADQVAVSEASQNKLQHCRSKTVNRIVPMVQMTDTVQTELPTTSIKNGASSGLISAQIDNNVQGIRLAPVVPSSRPSLSAVVDGVRRKCNQNQNNIGTPLTSNDQAKSTIFVPSDARSTMSDPCSLAKQAKLNPPRISESPSNRPFVKVVNTSLASCPQIMPSVTMTSKMPTSYSSNIQTIGGGSMTSSGSHIVVIDQNSTVNADSNHLQITGYPVRQSQDQCYISAAKPQPQIAGYDINRNHVVSSDATVTPVMLNGTNIIVNNAAPSAQMLSTINGVLSAETSNSVASSRQPGAGVKSPLMTNIASSVNELSFALASPGPACPPTAASMVMNPVNSVNIAADTSNNGTTCFTSTPIYSSNDSSAISCFTSLLCKPTCQPGIQNSASATEDCAQDPSIRSNKVQTIKRAKVNPTILSTYSSNSANILLSSPSVELQQQVHHPQPAAMQLQGPFVQVNPYASLQNIQLAPSLAGITVVPASKTSTLGPLGSSTQIVMAAASNQQLHHHSQGQQPSYNLLGHSQTILLPTTGMIVASDSTNSTATLLQVQNMSQCTGGTTPVLTAPGGIVLRTQNMPTTHAKPTANFLPAITHQPFTLIAGNNANSNSRHVSPGNVLQPSVFTTSFNGGIRSGDSASDGAYVGSAGASLNIVSAKSIAQMSQHVPLQMQPPITLASNVRKMDIHATADTVVDTGTSFAEPVLLHCDSTTRCHPVNSESFSKFTGSSAEVKVADNTTSIYIIKESGCAAGIDTSTSMNKGIPSAESDESTASSRDKQNSHRAGLEKHTMSLTIKDKCSILDDNDNETNQNALALGGDSHLSYPLLLDSVSSLNEEPRAHSGALDRMPKQQSNGAVN